MPIYAFACAACGHHFDRLQKLSDPDPAACPACGAHAVKRQVTAPSFRLSGSGWYETDFKKDGDKKRNLTEKAEGGAAKTDAKAEAKPVEAKSDAKPEAKPAKAEAPAAKPAAGTP
jgi:putative FmdB family regulatory protein